MNRARIFLSIFSILLFFSSCSKDEEKINHRPVAAFSYSDEIDEFILNVYFLKFNIPRIFRY